MLADLDETVRQLLIRHVPLDLTTVDVSFDAPDREWSGRLSRPTVNCFLYDVRENEDLREAAWDYARDAKNGTVQRRRVPVRINATYNVTVWARAPEDEHRLLWRVLTALARHPVLNLDTVEGGLKEQPFPLLAKVAKSDTARANPADLWQALDNRIRPSLTYVLTLALDPDTVFTSPMVFHADHPHAPAPFGRSGLRRNARDRRPRARSSRRIRARRGRPGAAAGTRQ